MVGKSKEKVVDMTNKRNVVAWCVAMAFAVVSISAVAQDDLDSLLKDLETESGEKAATPAKAEKKAESIPEAEEATEAKAETKAETKAEEPVAEAVAEAKVEEPVAEAKVEEKVEEKANVAPSVPPSDAELIENIRNTELVRRKALDVQAKREIDLARQNMAGEEYDEAVRHYGLALKLLNDRQSSKAFRKECDLGIA